MTSDRAASRGEPRPLDTIQRWFQAVITHPGGVGGGVASPEARRLIILDRGELEGVIRRSTNLTAEERLGIYASAYYARLLECLGEFFPVLKRALGAELFNEFAYEYLQREPPSSYTLDRLGDRFPAFLSETRPDRDGAGAAAAGPAWPDFLIDLARLELAVAEVFDGPGVESQPTITQQHLDGLTPSRFADARLETVPCLRLLAFNYPVNAFYTAVRKSDEADEVAPPDAAPEWVAVTRRDFVVRRYPLSAEQFVLLKSLTEGATVGESIAAAARSTDLDPRRLAAALRSWFTLWTAAPLFSELR